MIIEEHKGLKIRAGSYPVYKIQISKEDIPSTISILYIERNVYDNDNPMGEITEITREYFIKISNLELFFEDKGMAEWYFNMFNSNIPFYYECKEMIQKEKPEYFI